jgi:LysR family hydrogen peroxide-inducible transcriptional activator
MECNNISEISYFNAIYRLYLYNVLMNRLPTLSQLRHLVAIADLSSFSKAADACFITQASISASVKELESGLGETLIERTKRSVRLTQLGEEVTRRARDILNQTEDLVGVVAAAGAPLSGKLRLGIIPTISPFLLPRVLPQLAKQYPNLDLSVTEDQSAPLVAKLRAGNLDALVLAFPYPVDGMTSTLFANDPFLVALPRRHPLTAKERLTARDLKGETLLLLDQGHCLRDHILGAGGVSSTSVSSAMQATSLHTLVQMVEGGMGLTLIPKMAVDAGILRGTKLQVRPLETARASRQIGLAYRPTSPRTEDFALLADILRDELGTPIPRQSANYTHNPE